MSGLTLGVSIGLAAVAVSYLPSVFCWLWNLGDRP